MAGTRSSAATKWISDVPGLAKQTSTPPATRVRTRLSAPFIVPLPFTTFSISLRRSTIVQAFGQRVAAHCWHRGRSKAGFSATLELEINRSRGRGLRNRGNYGLSRSEIVVCEEQNDPRFCFPCCHGGPGGR